MAQKTGRVFTGDAKTRLLPRIPVTLPVRFRLSDDKEQDGHRGGWALDLSLGGMLLRCDAPAGSIGSDTQIHVQFPVGEKWLDATGKVVWKQPSTSDHSNLVGICFVDFEGEERDLLQRFMDGGVTS